MDINQIRQEYNGKTVHIVGNAKIKTNLGENIDYGDAIVRFNLGYLFSSSLSLNYGKKTHVLSIASSKKRRISKEDLDNLLDMKLIIWIDSIWPELNEFLPDYIRDDKRTYFYKREDWEYLFDALKGNKPSSGIMVFDLFHRKIGANVKLYGFDWWKGPTNHHSKSRVNHNPHNGSLEEDYMIRSLNFGGKKKEKRQ